MKLVIEYSNAIISRNLNETSHNYNESCSVVSEIFNLTYIFIKSPKLNLYDCYVAVLIIHISHHP